MSFAEKLRSASPEPDRSRAGVTADRLREAMGMLATGVSVITTRDPDGRPLGTPASTVGSVSLSPPLVLACLREESQTLAALLARRKFAINVLSRPHTELPDPSAAQATRDTVGQPGGHDIPVLEGAIVTLRCDLHDIADGGDHSVIVGHVIDLERHGSDQPSPVPIGERIGPRRR